MTCPICQKRKAKRFCPAKGENICSVCCGTDREVSIDCPSDCSFLMASRAYDRERTEREFDWSKLPFAEVKIPPSFARDHLPMLNTLSFTISRYAQENRPLVDSDAVAALQALAESYRTLSTGIYYEKPPDYIVQRGLYDALKNALEEFKKAEAQRTGLGGTRDSEIRDTLIFFTQLGVRYSNGRPKSRAYLDLLRSQFKPETLGRPESNLIVMP